MDKSLYERLRSENKKRFGLKVSFTSHHGAAETMGICTYEDMSRYSTFGLTLDFGGYEKWQGDFNNVDKAIQVAVASACKSAKITAF